MEREWWCGEVVGVVGAMVCFCGGVKGGLCG